MTNNLDLIKVGLEERSYPIYFGQDFLSDIGSLLNSIQFPRKISIISNDIVFPLYGEKVLTALEAQGFDTNVILIPDGEEFKNLATLESIYNQLIEANLDRGCGVLALGGGVIGDIAGYAAASFLRGIPIVQVPTTILAQVDSSVGGKTGVNHPKGKNLIGAFYQPKLVAIDISTLQTLDPRDVRAGMAEIIKYGVIRDAIFFNWLEENVDGLLHLDAETLLHAVKRSCQIKADIVEVDEREGSIRALLNYGHTFGHTIESLCGYGEWRHGEAVACGMVVASRIAQNFGISDEVSTLRIENLLRRFQLPITAPTFTLEQYVTAMRRDKKVNAGRLTMVLNRGIGEADLRPVENLEEIFHAVLPELEA